MAPGRKTGGKVKGSKHKTTIERETAEAQWKRFFEERLKEVTETQWKLAKGVSHLMAKDLKTGQFTKVTDPALMKKVLDSGEKYYDIHAQNPDGNTLKDILNRLLGMPKLNTESKVSGTLIVKHELPD